MELSLTYFESLLSYVLDSIVTFISTPPIFWVFGLIFVIIIIKFFISLFNLKF